MRTEKGTAANAFRARVFGGHADRLIAFVCECGDPDCRRTVVLSLDDYTARRPDLLIHRDHGGAEEPFIRLVSKQNGRR